MRPSPARYPWPLQLIHWLLALGVLGQLALALVLTQLRSLSFGQSLLGLHQQVGLGVLGLVIARAIVGRFHRAPKPVAGLPGWQHRFAVVLHVVLLALILAQPLLGITAAWGRGESLSLFGLVSVDAPFELGDAQYERVMRAHIVVASLLLGIVLLHIAAVAFNRVVRNVNVMERMLPRLAEGDLRNRMPVAAQLALAFTAVLAIGVCSGVYSVSKYRAVTRLEAAVQNGDVAAADAARQAQVAWKELKGIATAGSRADAAAAERARELAGESRSQVETAAAKTSNVESKRALQKLQTEIGESIPRDGAAWPVAKTQAIDDTLQEAVDELAATLFQARTEYEDQAARGHDLIVVSLLPMMLAAVLVAVLLARSITGSLVRTQALVRAIGSGEARGDVQVTGHGEFSALVRETLSMGEAVERRAAESAAQQRALEVERLQLIEDARERAASEKARLHAEKAETESRARRERDQQAEVLQQMREREAAARIEAEGRERIERERQRRALAENFETHVASLVKSVGSTVAELSSAADRMARFAGSSVQRSRQASELALETHETAAGIAKGAGELSTTANGVRGQAEQSRTEALAAVADAAEARALIEGLIDAVQQISGITGMIAEVSRKSEMLGINARIEAARAGDAGRGFAVVATDVKELAAQTREANERIEKQIASVGKAAQRSAEFLRRIGTRVETLGTSAAQILESADTQCQSSARIAERMASVSRSTQSVAGNVSEAQESAAATEELSGTVLDSARTMDEQTRQMQRRVSEFVLAIQGVARSVDRVALESVA